VGVPADDFEFDYHYSLAPTLYDREYQIGVRLETGGRGRVEDFAALLFWVRSDGRVVEVARIDDRDHPQDDLSGLHIHRWYREESRHARDYDIPVSAFEDAEEYLTEHFERFRHSDEYDALTEWPVTEALDELEGFLNEYVAESAEYQETLVGESEVRARLICWGVVGS
jgi:hypothetical protein